MLHLSFQIIADNAINVDADPDLTASTNVRDTATTLLLIHYH